MLQEIIDLQNEAVSRLVAEVKKKKPSRNLIYWALIPA
jgi:uncharacterized small protein (DUF1192 family)